MSDSKPPPYSDAAPPPGFTPASYYQPPPAMQHPQPQYPPQYAAMPQPQATTQSTVIIQTLPVGGVGNAPSHVTCPSCRAQILTKVRTEPSSMTHLWAILLCVFGCWPCVCLPYCMDSCQNANHYCPNCNAYIGTYQN